MTVRQAGAPVSDTELDYAAAQGMSTAIFDGTAWAGLTPARLGGAPLSQRSE
jgi:hypothetical protein